MIECTHVRVDVRTDCGPDRDTERAIVLRYMRDGDERWGEVLGTGGEWHRFEAYATIPPEGLFVPNRQYEVMREAV